MIFLIVGKMRKDGCCRSIIQLDRETECTPKEEAEKNELRPSVKHSPHQRS